MKSRRVPTDPLNTALRSGLVPIGFVFLFSLATNLLYLFFPLYINQIYSRVLLGQSVPTLVVLTGGICFVLVLSALL